MATITRKIRKRRTQPETARMMAVETFIFGN